MNEPVNLIAEMRGGFPPRCGFCGRQVEPEDVIPEEGGEWACRRCWERWEANDHPDTRAGELIPEDGA